MDTALNVLTPLLILLVLGLALLLAGHLKETTVLSHRMVLLLQLLLAVVTCALLAWHHCTPDAVWQEMVSPGPGSNQPRGMRTYSTVFWVLSWVLILVPVLGLRVAVTRTDEPGALSVAGLRVLMGYAMVSGLSLGLLYL